MKRKEFIHKVGLSALGISLLPSIAMASDSDDVEFFDLPEVKYHVRHSGFMEVLTPETKKKQKLPTLEVKSRDVFYKNGVEPSKEDLQVTSFYIAEQLFSVQKDHLQTTLFVNGKMIMLEHDKPVIIGHSKIELITINKEFKRRIEPSYVLPLSINNVDLTNRLIHYKIAQNRPFKAFKGLSSCLIISPTVVR